MVKISVIVPIYNAESYLRKCLDSLVNQTLKDIEIICINDCSPDNSLAILKEYAKKDKRVKIINFKKNKGNAVARNFGLAKATGKYIGIVDSDDYVDLDFYEKLYEFAKDKNVDIVAGNCKITDFKGKAEKVSKYHKYISKHKCYFYTHFWTAIYRNVMLKKHSIKFPTDNAVWADICFLNHAVIAAKDVHFLSHIYYHYIRMEDSLDSKFYSNEKVHSSLYCFNFILNRLNSSVTNKLHYSVVYNAYFRNIMSLLRRNSNLKLHKKIIQSIIDFYQKCKFPEELNLSKYIISTLKEKNKKELHLLLLEWMNNGFYPDINVKESILQKHKLYVWGAGVEGARVQMQCEKNNWKIFAFLDSNKEMKEFNGYKVKLPEKILNKSKRDFFIIISSRKYGKEIAKACMKAGLKRGVDFWRPS